jgi:Leucine Rich repeat
METVIEMKIVSRWRTPILIGSAGAIVLLITMAVVAAWMLRGAQRQRDAVAAIERIGGEVGYDREWTDGAKLPAGNPPWPGWLVRILGVDCFRHVKRVSFPPGWATDSELAIIAELNQVEAVVVPGVKAEPPAAPMLTDLLYRAWVEDFKENEISDDGLIHLTRLTHLRSLDLSGTRITDAGLAHLRELKSLRELDVAGTRVTDAGTRQFTGLTRLQRIHVPPIMMALTEDELADWIRARKLPSY